MHFMESSPLTDVKHFETWDWTKCAACMLMEEVNQAGDNAAATTNRGVTPVPQPGIADKDHRAEREPYGST